MALIRMLSWMKSIATLFTSPITAILLAEYTARFFTPTSLGLAWLHESQPQAEDFVRLKQVPFRHALCGHGAPARDATAGYHASFNRFFQV